MQSVICVLFIETFLSHFVINQRQYFYSVPVHLVLYRLGTFSCCLSFRVGSHYNFTTLHLRSFGGLFILFGCCPCFKDVQCFGSYMICDCSFLQFKKTCISCSMLQSYSALQAVCYLLDKFTFSWFAVGFLKVWHFIPVCNGFLQYTGIVKLCLLLLGPSGNFLQLNIDSYHLMSQLLVSIIMLIWLL